MSLRQLAASGAVLGVLALLGAAALDQSAPAERGSSVLRARAIEIVDARGEVRAELKVERSGEVVLRLRDEAGAIRTKLGASRTGSGLLLLNEATEPGVQALAGAKATTLRLQRGDERTELVP
jgi:hypothetical protein